MPLCIPFPQHHSTLSHNLQTFISRSVLTSRKHSVVDASIPFSLTLGWGYIGHKNSVTTNSPLPSHRKILCVFRTIKSIPYFGVSSGSVSLLHHCSNITTLLTVSATLLRSCPNVSVWTTSVAPNHYNFRVSSHVPVCLDVYWPYFSVNKSKWQEIEL